MARLSRLLVPDHPHHVTQRGNRQEPVFFSDDDYRLYLDLLRDWAGKAKSQIWAYWLMPNHVHLILTPKDIQRPARNAGRNAPALHAAY